MLIRPLQCSCQTQLNVQIRTFKRDYCSAHIEELQTMLFQVELIINNAPLTYVYPNTVETCLTPNYLLLSGKDQCNATYGYGKATKVKVRSSRNC